MTRGPPQLSHPSPKFRTSQHLTPTILTCTRTAYLAFLLWDWIRTWKPQGQNFKYLHFDNSLGSILVPPVGLDSVVNVRNPTQSGYQNRILFQWGCGGHLSALRLKCSRFETPFH
ncbi:hypothetical protein AVEN_61553-1 [Araneus ventricosus]|uniref:Uncharacterized protein n=1 Tax=Araneus ventricosus TaxID=182803 RepID=A0A4Y2FGD6_ARAVE|nr:hypothetical protein AVEN_69394-1 [Araneus ventricosus]GBM43071.1 hypothetical protein AVEN_61553-1 [Araneus ventricosus]